MSTIDVTTGTFNRLVKRIEQALSFDLPLEEIHDLLRTEGVSEEDFFLLYQAAKLL